MSACTARLAVAVGIACAACAVGPRPVESQTWSTPQVELELDAAQQLGSLDSRDEDVFEATFDVTFDALLSERWQMRLRPRLRDDDDGMASDDRWRLVDDGERRAAGALQEATLTRYGDRWQVRFGVGRQRWGTGDLYRPSDDVDALDFLEPSDPEDIGTAHLALTRVGARGDLQVLWWPRFAAHRLPGVRDRWFPDLRSLGSGLPIVGAGLSTDPEGLPVPETASAPVVLPDARPPSTFENSTFGLRLASSTLVGGWDLAFTVLRGPDRFGVLELVPLQGGPSSPSSPTPAESGLGVRRLFPRFTELAASFSTTAGSFEWHGEMTHRFTEGTLDDDYLQGLAGVTYTLDHHLPAWVYSAVLVVEASYEELTDAAGRPGVVPVSFARPFTETVLAAVRLELPAEARIEFGGVYNLSGDRSWRAEWRRPFGDHWTTTARVEVFDGAPETFFGAWRDLDRAMVSLVWNP